MNNGHIASGSAAADYEATHCLLCGRTWARSLTNNIRLCNDCAGICAGIQDDDVASMIWVLCIRIMRLEAGIDKGDRYVKAETETK